MKKNLKNIIIIIAMVVVGFGVYYLINKVTNKYRWANQTENVADNTANGEITENIVEENKVEEKKESDNSSNKTDSKTNKELKKVELSDEEIVAILIDTDPFEGADELSTEKKLEIVYNALNENKFEAYRNRGDGQAKVEYTEGEVNGIVYSLFGSELKENKSYGTSFVYKDGKYTLEHSDRGEESVAAKNIEYDVAAGTMYINYDLYVDGSLKGSYAIGKNNQTKFVTCKKEM